MANHSIVAKGLIPVVAAAILLLPASCNSSAEDLRDAARLKITKFFNGKGIYERDNVPEDPNPPVKSYYDVIGGAYRYIVKSSDDWDDLPDIVAGDSISFYFKAYVFTGSDSGTPYATNIASEIAYISQGNPQFDISDWSTDPLKIKVGSDPQIMKPVQNALLANNIAPACRPGDQVRIYLTSDLAYGNKGVGTVLGKSTVVFEITSLAIVEPIDAELAEASKASRAAITSGLQSEGIYERDNLPDGVDTGDVNGWYDIVGGAYRYIVNEDRAERSALPDIKAADSLSLYFDARIYADSYETSATYSTNIESRIAELAVSDPGLDTSEWPADPLKIKIGSDPQILKSVQNTLPTCKPGDVVRIFLPPDAAYGNKQSGTVPALSTLAFELTNIEKIE